MIKFMAFLMFGGLFLASCSKDEEDEIKPEELDLIVTPQLICGNDTIQLNGHAEPAIAVMNEMIVNFENGAGVRSAEVTIQSMKAVNGNESMTWEAGDTVYAGKLSVNNMAYIQFAEPLYFVYGHKYQMTIKATDAQQKETAKAFTFNGACNIVDFEGEYWNKLIDKKQYGGELIYSADAYKWTDAATTLSSEVVKADWSAWGSGFGWDYGFAISNYVKADAASYQEQLSVSKANGNFAVAYNDNSTLTFTDGLDHEIVSIDIAPVAYAYNLMKKACGKGYSFQVILNFVKADGSKKEVKLDIAKDDLVQEGFLTYTFNQKAKSVVFTFDGSDKGDWGLNTPKYVAIDNIVIK